MPDNVSTLLIRRPTTSVLLALEDSTVAVASAGFVYGIPAAQNSFCLKASPDALISCSLTWRDSMNSTQDAAGRYQETQRSQIVATNSDATKEMGFTYCGEFLMMNLLSQLSFKRYFNISIERKHIRTDTNAPVTKIICSCDTRSSKSLQGAQLTQPWQHRREFTSRKFSGKIGLILF